MISDLIHTFLNNFHYLNAKGHRSGCLLFFADKGLTTALEKNAKKLREDLTLLAQKNDISEEEKGNAFYDLVHNSFQRAEAERAEHGHPLNKRKNPPINMLDQEGRVTKNYWVKPRKPAKFEKQLVQGLNALHAVAAASLMGTPDPTGILDPFIRKCQLLSADISNFKRQESCISTAQHIRHKTR